MKVGDIVVELQRRDDKVINVYFIEEIRNYGDGVVIPKQSVVHYYNITQNKPGNLFESLFYEFSKESNKSGSYFEVIEL